MNQETFDKYTRRLLTKATQVRHAKRSEYCAEEDRLSNFRKAAHVQDTSIEGAISGMMAKHTVSIYDMVNGEFETFDPNAPYPIELWEEKIIDNINYLILLYAAVRESKDG